MRKSITKFTLRSLITGLTLLATAAFSTEASAVTRTWTGTYSDDWNTDSNWVGKLKPISTTDASIPTVGAGHFYPHVKAGAYAYAYTLTINTGAKVTIDSASGLILTHALLNNGTFIANDYSTLRFQETAAGNGAGIIGNVLDTIRLYNLDVYLTHTSSNFKLYSPVTVRRALDATHGGKFFSNGYLTLESTDKYQAYIKPLIYGGSLYDPITWKRNVTGTIGWTDIATPIKNATVGQVAEAPYKITPLPSSLATTTHKYYFMKYDESVPGVMDTGFIPVGNNLSPVKAGEGYFVYADKKPVRMHVKGLMTYGSFSFPLKYTNYSSTVFNLVGDGWNLLGNPYPADIKWAEVSGALSRSGIDDYYYTYNAAQGNYVACDFYGNGINGGTQRIPQGQGFFIHVNNPRHNNLTLTERAKIDGATTFFYKNSPDITNRLSINGMNVNGFADESVIQLREDASASYDANADAVKLPGEHLNISTVSENNQLAMNGLPSLTEGKRIVPMHFENVDGQAMTITFKGLSTFNENMSIFVENTLTGEMTDLKANPSFAIAVEAGKSADNYKVIFSMPIKGGAVSANNHLMAYPNPIASGASSFTLAGLDDNTSATVEVMDVTGRLVSVQNFSAVSKADVQMNAPTGVYIIRVTQSGEMKSFRMIRE